MSPRWFDKRTGDNLALDTGGGALARLWATALANKVDTPYVNATGESVKINLPKTPDTPEADLEWKIPQWSNAIERDRARIYFVAYAAGMALHFLDKAFAEVRAGRTKTFEDFDVPEEAIGCGFHEAVRGVLSHHLVIRDGKIANYHPYPPTPWNGSPTDSYGTPGPYEDAVRASRSSRRTPGQLPRHRHHARRAQLRPVPAVRRAHVPGQGQDHPAGPLADVRRAWLRRAGRPDDRAARERVARSRRCSRRSSRSPTRARATTATEPSQALLDLYGEGLARLVGCSPSTTTRRAGAALAGDELVSHLLLLHGLHPVPLEQRVRGALDEVARTWSPTAAASSCSASRTASSRLGLEGSCDGCPSSTATSSSPSRTRSTARARRRGIEARAPSSRAAGRCCRSAVRAAAPPRAGPAWATAGPLPELGTARRCCATSRASRCCSCALEGASTPTGRPARDAGRRWPRAH